MDFTGKSARVCKLRQTSIIAKYCSQSVDYTRYHEGKIGKWTLFGKSEQPDKESELRFQMKAARCRLENSGGLIDRLSRIIEAGKSRVALSCRLCSIIVSN